jgi:RNA polymerase sigma factor (sigma-70 family)
MLASLPENRVCDRYAHSDADLLRLYCEGSEWAAAAIHHRYEKRVRGLAQQHWPLSMRSRYDPEDIVQDVFDRFFSAVQRGLYSASEEAGLWGFFLVVTLNQIRKVAARHLSRRRDVRQTVGQGGLYHHSQGSSAHHSCMAHSTLVVDELLTSLPQNMRQVVKRRLEGYTVPEIARELLISQRAAERLMQTVRQRIGAFFDLSSLPGPSAPIRLRQDTAKSAPRALANESLESPRQFKIA